MATDAMPTGDGWQCKHNRPENLRDTTIPAKLITTLMIAAEIEKRRCTI